MKNCLNHEFYSGQLEQAMEFWDDGEKDFAWGFLKETFRGLLVALKKYEDQE